MGHTQPAAAEPLAVISYDVFLDISRGPREFWSRSEIHFSCTSPVTSVVADLHAKSVQRVTLNGEELDSSLCWRPGQVQLPPLAHRNVLVAEFDYATTGDDLAGQGLYR